ncbi:hypothetical protein KC614_05085 [candidate division WWE3 bacterium]|uniref:Uncharacterized protein n=1 Tax=candidate division WWE3 bacterium TaxID=2053526 RepID=A0A955LL86_UNCKA|nr:hypothetical protein [candidate division WWE3 bacterium]
MNEQQSLTKVEPQSEVDSITIYYPDGDALRYTVGEECPTYSGVVVKLSYSITTLTVTVAYDDGYGRVVCGVPFEVIER